MGKNNYFGQLDQKIVKNFRMYKSGKRWVFAGLAFLGVGASATLLNQQNVHADTTNQTGDNVSTKNVATVNDPTQTQSATSVTTAQSINASDVQVSSAPSVTAAIVVSSSSNDRDSVSQSVSSQTATTNSVLSSTSGSITESNSVTTSVNNNSLNTPSETPSSLSSETSVSNATQTLADELDLRDGGVVSYTASQANIISSLNSSYGTSFIFSAYWNGDSSAGAAIYTDNASDAYFDNGWVGYYTTPYSSAMNLSSYTNIKFSNVTYSAGTTSSPNNTYQFSSASDYAGDIDEYFYQNPILQHLDFGNAFGYSGPIAENLNLQTLSLGSAFGSLSSYNATGLHFVGSAIGSGVGENAYSGFYDNPSLKVLDLRNTSLNISSLANYGSVDNLNGLFANTTNSSAALTDLYVGSAFNSIVDIDCGNSVLFGLSDNVKVHVSENAAVNITLLNKDGSSSLSDNHSIYYNAIKADDGDVIAIGNLPQLARGYQSPVNGYLININSYFSSNVNTLKAFINSNQNDITSASSAVSSQSFAITSVSDEIEQNVGSLNAAKSQVSSFFVNYSNNSVMNSLNQDFNTASSYISSVQSNVISSTVIVNSYVPLINSINSDFTSASNTTSELVSQYYSAMSSLNVAASHSYYMSYAASDAVYSSQLAAGSLIGSTGWTSSNSFFDGSVSPTSSQIEHASSVASIENSAISATNWSYFDNLNLIWSGMIIPYPSDGIKSLQNYSNVASSAVAVAASNVSAMWSVYSAMQVPESAAASVNDDFNVITVKGSASAVTASLLAQRLSSLSAANASAASSAANSQSISDANNHQAIINSAINSQSNTDSQSANNALNSTLASLASQRSSVVSSITNSINDSTSAAINSAASSAGNSAATLTTNSLTNSYQSLLASQNSSLANSIAIQVSSATSSAQSSANSAYNSLSASYQALLDANGQHNQGQIDSLNNSANAALASLQASASAALASQTAADQDSSSASLAAAQSSEKSEYDSLSASYQAQLAAQKSVDDANQQNLANSINSAIASLQADQKQNLATLSNNDAASARAALSSAQQIGQDSASQAISAAAKDAFDRTANSFNASLSSSYANDLAHHSGNANVPLISAQVAVSQMDSLVSSANVDANSAASIAVADSKGVDSDVDQGQNLTSQFNSLTSGLSDAQIDAAKRSVNAANQQLSADQKAASQQAGIAQSNAALVNALNDQAQSLSQQHFSGVDQTASAASQIETWFKQADVNKSAAQAAANSANAILSDANQQVGQLQSLNSQLADHKQVFDDANAAKSDANVTDQDHDQAQIAVSTAGQITNNIAQTNMSADSAYRSVASATVSAEVAAHTSQSLASQHVDNAAIQSAAVAAKRAADQAYQQTKVAQALAQSLISVQADAKAQQAKLVTTQSLVASYNDLAQSAAQAAQQAADQNNGSIAHAVRLQADAARSNADQALQTVNLINAQIKADQNQSDRLSQQLDAANAAANTANQTAIAQANAVQALVDQLSHVNVNDPGFSVANSGSNTPASSSSSQNSSAATFKMHYYGIETQNDHDLTFKSGKKIKDLKFVNPALDKHYVGATVQFKQNGQLHRGFHFSDQNVIKNIKAGTRFKVLGVYVYHGVARFVVGHGQWITANINYVDVLRSTATK